MVRHRLDLSRSRVPLLKGGRHAPHLHLAMRTRRLPWLALQPRSAPVRPLRAGPALVEPARSVQVAVLMGSHVMPQQCDRHPSARAWYTAYQEENHLLLYFCDHCTSAMVDSLVMQGFVLTKIPWGKVKVETH